MKATTPSPTAPPPAPAGTTAPESPPAAPAAPPADAPEPEEPSTPEDPPATPATPAAPAEAAANVPAPRMTAFQRGALRALGIGELVQRVEAAEAANASMTNERDTLRARVSELEATLPRQVAAASQAKENAVSQQVRAVLSTVGISPEQAPAAMISEATPEALLEKFNTLKGAEKTAFFRAHKAALKAAQPSAAK